MIRNVGETNIYDVLSTLPYDEYISFIKILKESKGVGYSIIEFGDKYYEYDDIRFLQTLTFTKENNGKGYLAVMLIHLMQVGILNDKDIDDRRYTREALSLVPFDLLMSMAEAWGVKFKKVCGTAYALMEVTHTHNPEIQPFKHDDIYIPIKFKSEEKNYTIAGCWSAISMGLSDVLGVALREKVISVVQELIPYKEATNMDRAEGLLKYLTPMEYIPHLKLLEEKVNHSGWGGYKDLFTEICVDACKCYIDKEDKFALSSFNKSLQRISTLIFNKFGLNAKVVVDDGYVYRDEAITGNSKAMYIILRPDIVTHTSPNYNVCGDLEKSLTENILPADLNSHYIKGKNHAEIILESIKFIAEAYKWDDEAVKPIAMYFSNSLRNRLYAVHPKMKKNKSFNKWMVGDMCETETTELCILLGQLFGIESVKWSDVSDSSKTIIFKLSSKYVLSLKKTGDDKYDIFKHYIVSDGMVLECPQTSVR